MTKYSITTLFLCFALCCNLQANELGKRYLKLGNTYRETGDYGKAEEYLLEGQNLVANSVYWSATAHEFLGYLYRDMAGSGQYSANTDYFLALAKDNVEAALDGFRKSVRQRDGSPAALAGLSDMSENLSKKMGLQFPDDDAETGYTSAMSVMSGYGNSSIVNMDNAKLKDIANALPTTMENFSAVNNRLKEFPAMFTQYPRLQFVNLKNNKIAAVPSWIGKLRQLKGLNLSGNKIKSLPASIAELQRLESMDLSDNKLKDIPSSIASLKQLKVLDISGNKIPFSQIASLMRSMPNTNIVFDRYERVEDDEETTE